MNLLNLILLIIITGFVLGLNNVYIPMAPMIKSLLNMLVFVLLLIYVLQYFDIIKTILPFPAKLNIVKGT